MLAKKQNNRSSTTLNYLLGILLITIMSTASANNLLDNNQTDWFIVNDTVMGGISNSSVGELETQTGIRFKGQLSLENNGGFASTVSSVELGHFASANKICLRARGDGRRYQFRLKTQDRMGAPAYVAEFTTEADVYQDYCFSVDDFTPQFRGRKLIGYTQLQFSQVKQLGFLIADKNTKPFQLDVSVIKSAE